MKIPPELTIKEQHRWIWLLLYAVGVLAALTGCGGGQSGLVLEAGDQAVSAAGGLARAAGELVSDTEFAA